MVKNFLFWILQLNSDTNLAIRPYPEPVKPSQYVSPKIIFPHLAVKSYPVPLLYPIYLFPVSCITDASVTEIRDYLLRHKFLLLCWKLSRRTAYVVPHNWSNSRSALGIAIAPTVFMQLMNGEKLFRS